MRDAKVGGSSDRNSNLVVSDRRLARAALGLSTLLPRNDKTGTATEDNNHETALEWRRDRSRVRACHAGVRAECPDDPDKSAEACSRGPGRAGTRRAEGRGSDAGSRAKGDGNQADDASYGEAYDEQGRQDDRAAQPARAGAHHGRWHAATGSAGPSAWGHGSATAAEVNLAVIELTQGGFGPLADSGAHASSMRQRIALSSAK